MVVVNYIVWHTQTELHTHKYTCIKRLAKFTHEKNKYNLKVCACLKKQNKALIAFDCKFVTQCYKVLSINVILKFAGTYCLLKGVERGRLILIYGKQTLSIVLTDLNTSSQSLKTKIPRVTLIHLLG